MTQTCYMCDAQRTSDEHVPPRCLFPEKKDLPPGVDLRQDLITVPSCDTHNSKKSKDDEYILYVLVMNIPNNEVAQNQFLSKIIRAINRNPSLINQFLKRQAAVHVHDSTTDKVEETIAMQIDTERFYSALEHIGRALYFYHFNLKWLGAVSVHPDFLLSLHPEYARQTNDSIELMAKLAKELFDNVEAHGNNPDVFKYQVVDGTKGVSKILRLQFYGGSGVTLFFKNGG